MLAALKKHFPEAADAAAAQSLFELGVEVTTIFDLIQNHTERVFLVIEYLKSNPQEQPRSGGGVRSMIEAPEKWPRVAFWSHKRQQETEEAQAIAARHAEAEKAQVRERVAAAAEAQATAETDAHADALLLTLLDRDPDAHRALHHRAFQALGQVDQLRLTQNPLAQLPLLALRIHMRRFILEEESSTRKK